MTKHIANAVTFLRIVSAVILLFLTPMAPAFFVFYTLGGVSDMLDGTLARHFDTVSAFGARLDSVADLLFFFVSAVLVTPMLWVEITLTEKLIIFAVLITKLVSMTICIIRFHTPCLLHTRLNKLTGFLCFLVPFCYTVKYFILLVCTVAAAAAAFELAHICLKKTEE